MNTVPSFSARPRQRARSDFDVAEALKARLSLRCSCSDGPLTRLGIEHSSILHYWLRAWSDSTNGARQARFSYTGTTDGAVVLSVINPSCARRPVFFAAHRRRCLDANACKRILSGDFFLTCHLGLTYLYACSLNRNCEIKLRR